jgi:hypothetical protein
MLPTSFFLLCDPFSPLAPFLRLERILPFCHFISSLNVYGAKLYRLANSSFLFIFFFFFFFPLPLRGDSILLGVCPCNDCKHQRSSSTLVTMGAEIYEVVIVKQMKSTKYQVLTLSQLVRIYHFPKTLALQLYKFYYMYELFSAWKYLVA